MIDMEYVRMVCIMLSGVVDADDDNMDIADTHTEELVSDE
jgi:hypothetical protein